MMTMIVLVRMIRSRMMMTKIVLVRIIREIMFVIDQDPTKDEERRRRRRERNKVAAEKCR